MSGSSPGRRSVRGVSALVVAATAIGCMETRDLGSTVPHGLLPVDERNPIVLLNDNAFDNWQGEYAILFANGGGPKLAKEFAAIPRRRRCFANPGSSLVFLAARHYGNGRVLQFS